VSVSECVLSSRAFRAYDGDGTFLGDFAAWLPAHEWAHQRAAEPLTRLPVEIEDRSRIQFEQVWPDRCQVLLHQQPVVAPSCPLVEPSATKSRSRLLDDTAAAPQGPGR